MAAYTVTTSPLSVLPPPDGRPPRAAQEQAALFRALLARDLPGQSTDDRFAQAQGYVGAVYIGVQALMKGLSGASVKVLRRRPGATAAAYTPSDAHASKDWLPVEPAHPLARLFTRVNPQDTLIGFLSQYVMCRTLTGRAFAYTPFNAAGRPAQLWVLRPQYVSPGTQFSAEYPFGSWRVSLPQSGLYGFAWGGPGLYVNLDAREVVEDRLPHPMYPWDGYSPLAAGGLQLDTYRSVNEARKLALERGPTLDALVTIAGASGEELERAKADYYQKYTGAHKGARVGFSSGDDIKMTALGITPKDMAFAEGYEQLTNFALALLGVPHPVAGLTDAGSYAQLYASIQQFRSLKLQPEANEIAAHWTKHLAHKFYGEDLAVAIELPALLNPEEQQQKWQAAYTSGAITVNEVRGELNLDPLDGGDVPPTVYTQKLQADIQQQQQAAQMQAQASMAPQVPPGTADGAGATAVPPSGQTADEQGMNSGQSPEDAATGAVLAALGVGDDTEANVGVAKAIRKASEWVPITTRTGKRAAQNTRTQEVVYGAEAEERLAGGRDARHNPDLDAAFGAPAAQAPKGDDSKLRDNPALDDVFGAKPQSKPAPATAPPAANKPAPTAGGARSLYAPADDDAPPPPAVAPNTPPQGGKVVPGRYTEDANGVRRPHYDDNGILTPEGKAAGAPEGGGGQPPNPVKPPEAKRLPPLAQPLAAKAEPALAERIPTLTPVFDTPRGQAALKNFDTWSKRAADAHAAAVAAKTGLDRAASHALILHLLAAVCSKLPFVGRAAGAAVGMAAGVATAGAMQAHKRHQDAAKRADKAKGELEKARGEVGKAHEAAVKDHARLGEKHGRLGERVADHAERVADHEEAHARNWDALNKANDELDAATKGGDRKAIDRATKKRDALHHKARQSEKRLARARRAHGRLTASHAASGRQANTPAPHAPDLSAAGVRARSGPPRPTNPAGKGSLPPRVKAIVRAAEREAERVLKSLATGVTP